MKTKIERLKELHSIIKSKAEEYFELYNNDKWNDDTNYEKYILYDRFIRRASELAYEINHGCNFGFVPTWRYLDYQFYQQERSEIKAMRKERFENTTTVNVWFMQASLTADYGTFYCDLCGYKFYHSPAILKKGKKEIAHCACGHCSNKVAQKEVYH